MPAKTKPAPAPLPEITVAPTPMAAPVAVAPPAPAAPDVSEITRALAEPFEQGEVKFKPQSVKGNRALALAYIDARLIQDRLDDVLGVEGWQDEYQLLPDGSVLCRLRLKLGKRWITKMDVGSPSEQPDGGDRLKAAFSDALKRAAVKFGIGRYLYRLTAVWTDYDPVKRQFTQTPQLPPFARPTPKAAPAARVAPRPAPASAPEPEPTPPPAPKSGLPETGAELQQRLRDADLKLHKDGLCPLGKLLAHVTEAGVKAGFGGDLAAWPSEAIQLAVEEVKRFKSRLGSPASKAVA